MDFYNTAEMPYTELAIALEDFTYGSTVKLSIPAIVPLLDKDKAITNKRYLSKKNIVNKDKNKLDITTCTETNYILLDVPLIFCPKCNGTIFPEYDLTYVNSNGEDCKVSLNHNQCDHKGYKGQKFIVTFIGGNINNPIIYRRV